MPTMVTVYVSAKSKLGAKQKFTRNTNLRRKLKEFRHEKDVDIDIIDVEKIKKPYYQGQLHPLYDSSILVNKTKYRTLPKDEKLFALTIIVNR